MVDIPQAQEDRDEIQIQPTGMEVTIDYGMSPTAANVILAIRWGKEPGLKTIAVLKQKMVYFSACHVRAQSSDSNGAQFH